MGYLNACHAAHLPTMSRCARSAFCVRGDCSACRGATPAKVALVIGNARYNNEPPLANPENDAQDMAEALSRIGFDVTVKLNVDYEGLRTALSDFTQKADGAEMAAVFYAGHGIEIAGENYLIPIDATLENESQIRFQSLELDLVTKSVNGASRLRIVFLDACRNNPFLKKIATRSAGKRSVVGRGLAPVEPDEGTVVAFAAREGTTASDGSGRNSPFTKALLKHIGEPGLDVDFLLRRVRDDVKRDTNGQQEPFKYGSLPAENVSLFDPPPTAGKQGVGKPAEAQPAAVQTAADPLAPAREAWEAIRNSDNKSDMETIVRLFPNTIYASFAEARLKSLASQPATQDVAAIDANDQHEPPDSRLVTPAVPESWFMAAYQNADFFGGDILPDGVRVETSEQCAALCANNLACRMFTFNTRAQRCFLKNGYDIVQRVDGVVGGFFFKGRQGAPAPSIDAQWELLLSADIAAADLGFTDDRDYFSCFQSCRANQQCSAMSFAGKLKRKKCWLKSGYTSNVVARTGVTSARRTAQRLSPFLVVPVSPKD